MDGRDRIEQLVKGIIPLQHELDAARNVVAEYSNNVYESIHTNERRIHAREAVRHLDFTRELLMLVASHLEQALDWESEIEPLNPPSEPRTRNKD